MGLMRWAGLPLCVVVSGDSVVCVLGLSSDDGDGDGDGGECDGDCDIEW